MKVLILCAVLIGCVCVSGCDKKNSHDNGEYIKCKVNGVEWESGGVHRQIEWADSGRLFNLSGYDKKENANLAIIVFGNNQPLESDTYVLSLSNVAGYKDQDISFRYGHRTDSINTGSITIIFDEANRRVSGSFSFKAKHETGSEIISITDGRFSMITEKN